MMPSKNKSGDTYVGHADGQCLTIIILCQLPVRDTTVKEHTFLAWLENSKKLKLKNVTYLGLGACV